MIKRICAFFLKIWGFKVTGHIPNELLKKLYIVIPHTSNWDFILGVLNKGASELDVQYLAKHTLFRWPFGWFFRATGGIPVDRSKNNNFVDAVVDVFNKHDKISIALAPEGTRKKVTTLKTGFYWIAVKAKVPIVMVKFDFGKKVVDYAPPFYPCGDYEKDYQIIAQHFKGTLGKNPEDGFFNA